jgi:hypothetical protein
VLIFKQNYPAFDWEKFPNFASKIYLLTGLKLIATLLFILIFFSQCKKDEFEPKKAVIDYLPAKIDQSWIYEVDSIVFGDKIDTFTYKEHWITEQVDSINANHQVAIISIYIQQNGSSNLTFDRKIRIEKTINHILFTDNNTVFLKMILPISLLSRWDVNQTNELEYNRGSVDSKMTLVTFGNKVYDNCLHISEEEADNIIRQKKGSYFYAPDLGLIQSKFINLSYSGSGGGNLKKGGYELYKKLL